eukprot:14169-Heterococcus_DN1.PRE.2
MQLRTLICTATVCSDSLHIDAVQLLIELILTVLCTHLYTAKQSDWTAYYIDVQLVMILRKQQAVYTGSCAMAPRRSAACLALAGNQPGNLSDSCTATSTASSDVHTTVRAQIYALQKITARCSAHCALSAAQQHAACAACAWTISSMLLLLPLQLLLLLFNYKVSVAALSLSQAAARHTS